MNPCPSCLSLADCGTCVLRLQYEATLLPPEPECLLCVDVDWLAATGTPGQWIPQRLGRSTHGLIRHLRRCGSPQPAGLTWPSGGR